MDSALPPYAEDMETYTKNCKKHQPSKPVVTLASP